MSIFQKITFKNFQVGYKNVRYKEKLFYYARYSSKKEISDDPDANKTTFLPFQEEIRKRRTQAKKSIIVQVQSALSSKELYSYCSSFGAVKQMFHYSTGIDPMHFIVVEFKQVDGVNAALSSGTFVDNNAISPTKSQFLWFRTGSKKTVGSAEKKLKKMELTVTNGITKISNDQIREELQNCETISEQIKTLYEISRLTDLESRLRFLTLSQVEMSLSGLFPNVKVHPFGSSVNGFGRMGCDLDVVLSLSDKKERADSRLVFHCKGSSGVDRSSNLRTLEVFGDMLHLFLPGCTRVRKILQARVPIIKYYQQFTNVECDLSMANLSGVHMSDFLYIMGALDPRVRPLVFAVRRWAEDVGLTNSSPGRWITNFSLTLLVLSFLQKPLHSAPILPALNTLVKSAEVKDLCITEEGVDCTFLRDVNKLNHSISNTENLENLLCEFFEYYSQFDFKTRSVSLNEAVTLTKPDNSALYIVNPLERGLNVSKNVSLEELDRFKEEAQTAAWLLQSTDDSNSQNRGLLSILGTKQKSNNFSFNSRKNNRLMHVKELFVDGENKIETNDKLTFKNDDVKKHVTNIKKENRLILKTLKNMKEPVR